jgi:3-(3-hydroxy-phenyl)propionate hydroxylase
MLCDPGRPATIVPGRGNHRRWEFMLLPGEHDAAMSEAPQVEALVAPWVGDAPCTIIRAATYRFHGLVAEKWRVGRIFLAGDAAHQTPPFFGQGMCHGLRDAANLGWKLALVQRGVADTRLLDTYQHERDAQVRHVISRAIEVGRTICILDPDAAAKRDAEVRAQTGMKTAAELIAPIQSTIIAQKAGERFINPRLSDGFLDDATGGGWVLLQRGACALTAEAERILQTLGAGHFDIESLDDPEGHLEDWFSSNGATAALVRPDFYVAAVGNGEDISRSIMTIADAMSLASAT